MEADVVRGSRAYGSDIGLRWRRRGWRNDATGLGHHLGGRDAEPCHGNHRHDSAVQRRSERHGQLQHGRELVVTGPAGWTGSIGSISSSGLYETPYPAPATVMVVATSTQDTTKSGSVSVALAPPAAAAGPGLTVDLGNQTHPINPLIYGMNGYGFVNSVDGPANPTVIRWGGDSTSRYNYQLGVSNSASDWYFENQSDAGVGPTGEFNDFVTSNQAIGAISMGTVPVLGWVAKNGTSCSFPTSTYPNQQSVDTSRNCGNGVYPQGVSGCTDSNGCNITGNAATDTSVAEGPAWVGGWVTALVGNFGTAANGGVAIYDLDNEPSWWDAVQRDVHPLPFTYDEATNNGIAAALAVKTADPTAAVSGPVMDFWWDYFYSKEDVEYGWNTGPCYEPWSNPVDRNAHDGIAVHRVLSAAVRGVRSEPKCAPPGLPRPAQLFCRRL